MISVKGRRWAVVTLLFGVFVFVGVVNAKTSFKRFVIIYESAAGSVKCDHFVSPDRFSLKKPQKDEIKWTIDNICPIDQKVLLCVFREKNRDNPFDRCESDAGADIGTVFTVPKIDGETKLTCHAKDTATASLYYQKQVLVGADIPANATCPDHPVKEHPEHHGPQKLHTHILDFDIQD